MPVRKRIDRRRAELPDDAWDWLRGSDEGEWHFFLDDAELADAWRKHGAEIVTEHIRRQPGTRPRRWWAYDAPRISAPGFFWDGKLTEQRRQVGGSGREYASVVPNTDFGIPTLLADVDTENPPLFESQAAYLDRHGLLSTVERRRLQPADFEPRVS